MIIFNIFRLPETVGVPLPQTLEEALNIGLMRSNNVSLIIENIIIRKGHPWIQPLLQIAAAYKALPTRETMDDDVVLTSHEHETFTLDLSESSSNEDENELT